ncbi:hypothetical protein [Cellulophaga baltica]|uniref:hypothetical protein n=1 Tax=Cellulophaga baltica TaxID=76594 RepID=UPI0003F72D96|nr:hypothetical protein [Cellulophaga baltica]MCR1024531.1 hypothetical protein [Cellulophaga baltica]
MERKTIINQLELAHSPITAYEFSITKKNNDFKKTLEESSLYIIAQRPVFSFENFVFNTEKDCLCFEIHQKENYNKLHCKLPLIQKHIGSKEKNEFFIALNYLQKPKTTAKPPYGNLHGFSICEQLQTEQKFLIWFSPEKLLYNWWNGQINCEIKGDFRSFLNYPVHYVGKATKQNIIKRLTGHDTFQDILSLESPVTKKQLPANEIVLLFFQFKDNVQFETFDIDSDIKKVVSVYQGETYPNKEKIFLDAEKALINAMKPNYNKELFKNYPRSIDGLYEDKYDVISYTFVDPINLRYSKGEIRGGLSFIGGDNIQIKDNEHIELIKHK